VRVVTAAITAALFLVLDLGWANGAPSSALQAVGPPSGHVTICHATGSTKNPFVRITPSAEGVLRGHVGLQHQQGRDIIPPFGTFAGQNWDEEGQAIWRSGCEVQTEAFPPVSVGLIALTALLGGALVLAQRRRSAGRE
jgi:hypothetical protein